MIPTNGRKGTSPRPVGVWLPLGFASVSASAGSPGEGNHLQWSRETRVDCGYFWQLPCRDCLCLNRSLITHLHWGSLAHGEELKRCRKAGELRKIHFCLAQSLPLPEALTLGPLALEGA